MVVGLFVGARKVGVMGVISVGDVTFVCDVVKGEVRRDGFEAERDLVMRGVGIK